MASRPAVTVVLSTWNRGHHIVPTLHAALRQDFADFEILIIGDGCDDGTGDAVHPYLSEKVKWINLPHRCGSQSFPNNVGIALARGPYIAYLGHDDIWTSGHLTSLVSNLESGEGCDFAVGGSIYHGPPGSGFRQVTGLFDTDNAKFEHFFPPSSVAHRRAVVRHVGLWRSPDRIRPPVDSEFFLRAAHAGCRFRSTGAVSVHKFAAGHRYLYYLEQSSDEQVEMLKRLGEPGTDSWVAGLISDTIAAKRFMAIRHPDFSVFEPGALAARNRINKGLDLPPLLPLKSRTIIAQTSEPRGLDWYPLHADYRWSGPSPRPKILLPFTSAFPVHITLELFCLSSETRQNLSAMLNGQRVEWDLNMHGDGTATMLFTGSLKRGSYSVVELTATRGMINGEPRGLALRNVVLEPVVHLSASAG